MNARLEGPKNTVCIVGGIFGERGTVVHAPVIDFHGEDLIMPETSLMAATVYRHDSENAFECEDGLVLPVFRYVGHL